MKLKLKLLPILQMLALTGVSAFAQGSLTPPGAPSPTMRTLAQIEPRIPVQTITNSDATAQFIITQSGSYYLTGNLTGAVSKVAIAINADNVQLDLGGHMILGVAGATRGIEVRNAHEQIVIENGTIRNFDFVGISAPSTQDSFRIERVSISDISAGYGISIGSASTAVLIRGCSINDIVGGGGISISITRGTVQQCVVSGCSSVSSSIGIQAGDVSDCEVSLISANGNTGVTGIAASIVKGCEVSSVSNTGSGSATGISAGVIHACHVSSVTAASGDATAISGSTVDDSLASSVNANANGNCRGITSVGVVANCRVSSIGNSSTSGGNATGINAVTAVGCSVTSIGGSGSSNSPVGIDADTVNACNVSTVGSSGSAAGAKGIFGSHVEGCNVVTVNAGNNGGGVGIEGDEVSHCNVGTVNVAGGPFNSTGILADVITHCRVSSVNTSGTANAVGLGGYRLASHCLVNTLTVSGGNRVGAGTSRAGRTENVEIVATSDTGISVNGGHSIIGCTVGAAGTGILAIGAKNIIDGNNVTGPGNTGISVTSGINTASALVIRNQVRDYTTNFDLDSPCQVGPVVSATGIIGAAANPWANFTD